MGALGVERTVRHKPLSDECGVACRIEWLGGRPTLHMTFLSAEGFEITERQIAQLGVVIVALPAQVAIGAPIRISMARAHGLAPLEIGGCVVYGMPQGAAVKLDFSSGLVKARWGELKRTRWATQRANEEAQRRQAEGGEMPSGVFDISQAGIDVYYKGGEGGAVMTLRLDGPQTLGRFHEALKDAEMLLAPPCVDAGIGETIEVVLRATSLDEVCFRARVVCRVPRGTIVEPVGLNPQIMIAIGELGRALIASDRVCSGVDSGAMLSLSRTPDSGPVVPLARTQPQAQLPRRPSSPELAVPHSLLQEDKPAPAQPLAIQSGRSSVKPLPRLASHSARKPKEHPQALRLREQAEAMASLNPWELLSIHWSAYDQLIEEQHEVQKARYCVSNYPPEIFRQAQGALEDIHAHLDRAREDLDTHLKRLVARKQLIDEKQIKAATGHYLERAKMAIWRGEREEAYDAYRRVYEIDPLNPEARKRFRKKGA